MENQHSYETKAFWFILLATIFRLIYGSGLGAVPDEADYFVWSQQLDLSYFCHPPMLMYFLAVVDRFIHDNVLVLRLVTTLLTAFSSVYVFHLTKELFDRRLALYCVVLSNLTLLFMAGSLLATPDTPMIFFLTGASYHFYLAVKNGEQQQWVIAGVLIGCALVSKFVSFLIYPSFFLYLLLPQNRKWLTKPMPYLSFLLSVLIFSPVIYWNSQHNWTTFAFQLQHGFGNSKRFPRWDKFFEYLGGQAGLIGPILFGLFLTALIATLLSWKKRSLQEKFLCCLASIPFLFFLVSSIQKKVEANWPCFAYVPGILLAMAYYERVLQQKRWGRILWSLNWGYTILVLALVLTHVYLPFIPIRKDRTDDFYGWDQLGAEVVELNKAFPEFGLAANRYQIASEIMFYANVPLTCFNIDNRPNQYDIWQDRSTFRGKNYLFFDDEKTPQASIAAAFERFEFFKSIPLTRGEKIVGNILVYKGYNYLRPEKGNM